MTSGRTGWMDKEREEVRGGIRKRSSGGLGVCVQVFVDAWRRQQGICAHDNQTAL